VVSPTSKKYPWLAQLLARRPFKVVVVALANKMARIAWALLAKGGTLREDVRFLLHRGRRPYMALLYGPAVRCKLDMMTCR
jgi:hypothetical protein